MRPATVEPALNLLLQPVGLGRVFGFDHSLGQLFKFLRSKRAAISHLLSKLDYPDLFFREQPFYLFDDLNRCYANTLAFPALGRKRGDGAHHSGQWPPALQPSKPNRGIEAPLAG